MASMWHTLRREIYLLEQVLRYTIENVSCRWRFAIQGYIANIYESGLEN
jgi:hypothetical protein